MIENRPGGGTNITTDVVVHAEPDGYTLLSIAPANAIKVTLYDRLNFNFMSDIAPVAAMTREPYVMLVHPSVSAKTVPEFCPFPNSSRWPRRIPASSTWRRPAEGRGRTWPASCSR